MDNEPSLVKNQIIYHFEVDASLLTKLGDELITDDISAIAELVKNAYDADASKVKIKIDPDYVEEDNNWRSIKGKITISDNGIGMDLDTIKNGWLTISRSPKAYMKEKGILTKQYKRLPLGDKGLGRLAAQRLGEKLTLRTKKKGMDQELIVNIEWFQFESGTNLSDVQIPVIYQSIDKKRIEKQYTQLIITGLVDCDNWKSTTKIDRFENSLSRIKSPFDFNKSFNIIAEVYGRRLELPEIDKEMLRMAPASYYFKVSEQQVKILGQYRVEYLYDIEGDRFEEFIQLYRNQLNKFNLSYIDDGSVLFKYEQIIDFNSVDKITKDFYPGPFEGYIYDYSLDSENFKIYKRQGLLERYEKVSVFRNQIKLNSGIKVFRDQFRILPYGDFDWLGLGKKFTSGSSYYFLKPGNTIGYINLTGRDNAKLRETTSREGFIEDNYSKSFFRLLELVIDQINTNRADLKRTFLNYAKIVNNRMEAENNYIPTYVAAKEEIKNVADSVNEIEERAVIIRTSVKNATNEINKTKTQLNKLPLNTDAKHKVEMFLDKQDKIVNNMEKIWQEIQNYLEQIKGARAAAISLVSELEQTMDQSENLIELAGLGMTAETLSHELFTLITNTKLDVQAIKKKFRSKYSTTDIKMESYFDSITARSDSIRKQVAHLAPGLKNVRAKKEYIDLQKLIYDHIDFYQMRAERLGIKMININPKVNATLIANRGMLMQVLDNLYINSEYWLQEAKAKKIIEEMTYNIKAFNTGVVYVWDNGIGIDKNMENRIFEPFITTKREGRGLGLYIVSRILAQYGCSIRLLEPLNNFGNRYIFSLNFASIRVEE